MSTDEAPADAAVDSRDPVARVRNAGLAALRACVAPPRRNDAPGPVGRATVSRGRQLGDDVLAAYSAAMSRSAQAPKRSAQAP